MNKPYHALRHPEFRFYIIARFFFILVLSMQATFHKKAVGKIRFECHDGEKIEEAVANAIATKEGVTCETNSKGFDEQGRCVAEFNITWTFKETSK